jgi:hypothetical protein
MQKIGAIFILLICLSLAISSGTGESPEKRFVAPNSYAKANDSEWTEPEAIAVGPYNCVFPKVTADDAGFAYAIWRQDEGRMMRFTTNEDGKWATPENITKGEVRLKEGAWPELTVDTKGNVFIVYTAVTDGNYEIVGKRRRGQTWDPHENVSKTQAAGSVSATPMVDVRNNDYFVHWQDDIDRPEGAVYWRTYVRYKEGGEGNRWIGAGAVGSANGRDYGPEAAMDINGAMYAVSGNRHGGISNIYFFENKTPKVNATWSNVMNISGPTGVKDAEPQIACDNEGNVYVVWMQVKGGNWEVFFRKRINGVWQNIENVSNTSGVSEFPTVAADRVTGKVYVAWHDNTPGNWEILFREFDGKEWKDVQNVSKSGSASARPDIYCDGGGGVHLVFLERTGTWTTHYMKRDGVYDFPIFSPLNLELKTSLNPNTSKKINSLTWEENPENERHTEFQYIIYRKEHGQADSQYKSIATLPNTSLSYNDRGLPLTKKYFYRMTCYSEWDEESEEPSNAVTEQWIWPALDPSLSTNYNRFLFYQEKINSLSWSPNPLNGAITIGSYDIYRKLTSQSDSEYALINSVVADVTTYQDRGLDLDEGYSYYIVVVDADGVQSAPSGVASEEESEG